MNADDFNTVIVTNGRGIHGVAADNEHISVYGRRVQRLTFSEIVSVEHAEQAARYILAGRVESFGGSETGGN